MAKESYDVVIVGAGSGGLNVGALLATAGKRVLVLERQQRVGGRGVSVKHRDFESLLAGSEDEMERVLKDAVYERSYDEIRALSDISVEKFVTDRTDDEGTLAWFRYMRWLYGGTRFPPTDMAAGSLFCTFKRRAEAHGGKLTDLGYMVAGGSGAISPPLAKPSWRTEGRSEQAPA